MSESPKISQKKEGLLAPLIAEQNKLIQEERELMSKTEDERGSNGWLDAHQHIANELERVERDIKMFQKQGE